MWHTILHRQTQVAPYDSSMQVVGGVVSWPLYGSLQTRVPSLGLGELQRRHGHGQGLLYIAVNPAGEAI